MSKYRNVIEITEDEVYPFEGHLDLSDPADARHAWSWHPRVAVSDIELERLNRLAKQYIRARSAYLHLLHRVGDRKSNIHTNDDGSVVFLDKEDNAV